MSIAKQISIKKASGIYEWDRLLYGLPEPKNGTYMESAKAFGEKFAKENGCKNAADVLEKYFGAK